MTITTNFEIFYVNRPRIHVVHVVYVEFNLLPPAPEAEALPLNNRGW